MPCERLLSQVGNDFRERRIVVHAGQTLANLGQHAVVAGPAIEAVQLKIDADVGVQVVITNRKRECRCSRSGCSAINNREFRGGIWIRYHFIRGIHFSLCSSLSKLRVGAWPSVYRSMPMQLAIDRFRLRFLRHEKADNSFHGEDPRDNAALANKICCVSAKRSPSEPVSIRRRSI